MSELSRLGRRADDSVADPDFAKAGVRIPFQEMCKPCFHQHGSQRGNDGNISANRGFAQELAERRGVHDAGARTNHFFCQRLEVSPFLLDRDHGGTCNESFASSHEDLVRNNADKGSAHQRASLTWTKKLFTRNGVEKFKEVAVEIDVPPLDLFSGR